MTFIFFYLIDINKALILDRESPVFHGKDVILFLELFNVLNGVN